jgi:hypothetical protein
VNMRTIEGMGSWNPGRLLISQLNYKTEVQLTDQKFDGWSGIPYIQARKQAVDYEV